MFRIITNKKLDAIKRDFYNAGYEVGSQPLEEACELSYFYGQQEKGNRQYARPLVLIQADKILGDIQGN